MTAKERVRAQVEAASAAGQLPGQASGEGGFLQVINLGGQQGPGTTSDPVDQLAKLADLRDRGALTDAEFQEQKRRILGEN